MSQTEQKGSPTTQDPRKSGDNRGAGDQDGNRAGGDSKSKGSKNPEVETSAAAEDPAELDAKSFGQSDAPEIDMNRQGISNRPGDEDPDSGVDREPGPRQVNSVN
jgi:hypothetical protein